MTALSRKCVFSFVVCFAGIIAGCGGGSGGSALSISASALPNGNLDTAYSGTISASGGTAPYTWSLTSGTLQAGLGLNASTGTINGTPTGAGTVSFTVEVTDSATPTANTATAKLSLTIQDLTITTLSLPAGTTNSPYNTTLAATGGTAPYAWSVTSGALPSGLSLCTASGTTCAITGTPTVGGVSTFSIQVTDSESPAVTFSRSFTLSLSPLSLLNNTLPNGVQNTPYSLTLDGTGGASPYTWSVLTGALPTGLMLDPVAGTISGTPTGSGTSVFTVRVADAETTPEVATKSLSLTIVSPTATLPPISCAGTPTGNESLLNGNYAFLVQGFQGGGSGSAVAIGASFAAGGAGQITGGDIDVSAATGSTHYTVASGAPASAYTVGLDPTGAGNLGCVMLTTSTGTTMTFRFSLGGVNSGIASKGKIIEFDDASGAGTIASGVLSLQQKSSSLSSPNYAFGLDGQTLSGSPIAEAGSFTLSGGTISGVFADVDIAGTNSSSLSGGSGSITNVSAADGRGTASLVVSGVSFAWAVYIVSPNEAYLVSTAFPTAGRALATSRSFTAGNYIAYSSGTSACGSSSCADVNLGLLNLSGGAATGTLWDYNVTAGESPITVSSGTYSSPAPSGRITFSNVGSNGLISYLVSPPVDGISAITVGTDAGAHFGYMTLQANTTVPAESLVYGTLDPRYNAVTTSAGTARITAVGALTGTEDDSSQNGNLQPGVAVARAVTLSTTTGAGTASSGGGSSVAVTDGTRIFWFDYNNGAPPAITVAEPQ